MFSTSYGVLDIKNIDKCVISLEVKYKKSATNPLSDTYASINIDRIPIGPDLTGLDILSSKINKKKLTTDVIEIIIFNITI